jgi:hypothetical protein
MCGTASTSSRVYAVCGSANIARLSPCSTMRPFRSTMVQSRIMRTNIEVVADKEKSQTILAPQPIEYREFDAGSASAIRVLAFHIGASV